MHSVHVPASTAMPPSMDIAPVLQLAVHIEHVLLLKRILTQRDLSVEISGWAALKALLMSWSVSIVYIKLEPGFPAVLPAWRSDLFSR
jgi:hypothetical protein